MDLKTLKGQIKTGEFDNFYVWNVEEAATARLYRDMIAQKVGAKIAYADTISDVFSKARQKSLIKSRMLYVIINDKEFLKNEKAWAALGDGRSLKDDIVIFYYTESDKRLKFWKNYKDRVVEFTRLDNRILEKQIQKEMPLSEASCHKLIEICEGNYSRIQLELNKLRSWLDKVDPTGDDWSWDKGLDRLIDCGAIYRQPQDAIFDFTSAVLDRDPKKAYNLLEQSHAIGEPNMVLITVLYNNFRALLQVQTCGSSDVSKSTGLNGFQIKNVKPFIDRYTDEELEDALRILREAETGIKTGRVADDVSMDYCLVNIL